MKFQLIDNCCTMLFMSKNPYLGEYENRMHLYDAIRKDLAKMNISTGEVHAVAFVTNTQYTWWGRRMLRKKFGITLQKLSYKLHGEAAFLGVIQLPYTVRTWEKPVAVKVQEVAPVVEELPPSPEPVNVAENVAELEAAT